jgi:hypothetical protein
MGGPERVAGRLTSPLSCADRKCCSQADRRATTKELDMSRFFKSRMNRRKSQGRRVVGD